MQTKLILNEKELLRLPLAAKFAGAKVQNVYQAAGEIHAEVSARDYNYFVKLGQYLEKVSDKEAAEFNKSQEKAKSTAEKAA